MVPNPRKAQSISDHAIEATKQPLHWYGGLSLIESAGKKSYMNWCSQHHDTSCQKQTIANRLTKSRFAEARFLCMELLADDWHIHGALQVYTRSQVYSFTATRC
jgi:hypothetical protein